MQISLNKCVKLDVVMLDSLVSVFLKCFHVNLCVSQAYKYDFPKMYG